MSIHPISLSKCALLTQIKWVFYLFTGQEEVEEGSTLYIIVYSEEMFAKEKVRFHFDCNPLTPGKDATRHFYSFSLSLAGLSIPFKTLKFHLEKQLEMRVLSLAYNSESQ